MESWDVIVIGGEVSSMDDVDKKITEADFLLFSQVAYLAFLLRTNF